LDGKAEVTGALFDTFVKNVRNSDPDDPTVQDAPFDQRVKGIELGLNGYITEIFELTASYTHLIDKITATSDPLSQDKQAPNTPHDAGNLWATLEPTAAWSVGAGLTTISHRYADTENTAGVPGYVVFNAMSSYQWNEHLKLQVNVNNLTNKLYFTGMYYTGIDENHALPNPGLTVIGTVSYRF
jgi:catecholate siderophore receptor